MLLLLFLLLGDKSLIFSKEWQTIGRKSVLSHDCTHFFTAFAAPARPPSDPRPRTADYRVRLAGPVPETRRPCCCDIPSPSKGPERGALVPQVGPGLPECHKISPEQGGPYRIYCLLCCFWKVIICLAQCICVESECQTFKFQCLPLALLHSLSARQ